MAEENKPREILGYALGQPDYILIGALLLMLILNFNLLSEFKQIPSPIYGGDFYNGLGGVNHIMAGGSVFESAQMLGEIPWVPWLYHLCVSVFATVTGLGPMKGLIFFSLPVMALGGIVAYLFISRITGNKYLSVAGVVLFLQTFPIFKYSDFAAYLMVPAFALMLYEFVKRPDMKTAAYTGVLLGLAGLSNTQSFFVGFLLLGLAFLFFFLPRVWRENGIVIEPESMTQLKMYAVILVAGFVISLLFWFQPIFVFHGNTMNPIQDITTPDATNPVYLQATIIDYSLKPFIVPYGLYFDKIITGQDFAGLFLFLLLLAGLAHFAMTWKSLESRFMLMMLLAVLLMSVHPLITMPLFGKHLVNFMMVDQLRPLLQSTLIAAGALLAFRKAQKEKARKIISAAVIIICFGIYLQNFDAKTAPVQGNWLPAGKQALWPPIAELESWVKANTGVNDVFLTSNEDSFMMNAVTGRKVLSYRRAHSSPYTDMNTRMADQAVIVYGSDDSKATELVGKYKVKYLLWTSRWLFNEFSFDQQGNMIGFSDPLNIPNNASNIKYWDSHGVRYLNATMALDPNPRTGVPQYDMLVGLPYVFSVETPYNPNLLFDFELVKTIQYQGQDAFRVYRIRSASS